MDSDLNDLLDCADYSSDEYGSDDYGSDDDDNDDDEPRCDVSGSGSDDNDNDNDNDEQIARSQQIEQIAPTLAAAVATTDHRLTIVDDDDDVVHASGLTPELIAAMDDDQMCLRQMRDELASYPSLSKIHRARKPQVRMPHPLPLLTAVHC